jgi:hypothetical protein
MRRLALALAGAAAIALLSPATALAAPAPAPPSTFKLPNGTTFNPQTAKCTTVKTATGNSERCVQVQRLPLKYLTSAQSAERQRMMAGRPADGARGVRLLDHRVRKHVHREPEPVPVVR